MQIEMKEIFLTNLNVDAKIEQILRRKGTDKAEEVGVAMSSELSVMSTTYGHCSVTVKLSTLSGFFSLSATYMGLFTFENVTKDMPEDEVKKLRAVCSSRMFPYIRELVADITRREPMGAPVFLATDLMDESKLIQQLEQAPTKPIN